MAIRADLAQNILQGITAGGSVNFDEPFIGLMAGGSRINYEGYSNVRIDIEGIKGGKLMGDMGTDGEYYIITSNPKENIYFPENTGGAVTANGWGLFSSYQGGTPYLTGDLKEPIHIGFGDVPLIRGGDLILKVK